jgi:hypothetical protein
MNKFQIDMFSVLLTLAVIIGTAIVAFAGFMLILLSRAPV